MANRNQQPMSKIVTMRVQVFAKGAKFSMFKPAEEMVYIGLDEESRTKGKAAIDVVGAQSGKSAGSVLQQVTPLSSLHMLQTPTVCQFAKCKSQLGMITTAGSSSSFSTELQTFSRLRQQYLALPCIQKYHHLTNMQVMTVISNALQGANMHCADNIMFCTVPLGCQRRCKLGQVAGHGSGFLFHATQLVGICPEAGYIFKLLYDTC